MAQATTPVGALSENIAFLAQFGKTIDKPTVALSRLQPTKALENEKRHTLTFEEERDMAQVFALLLATTPDSNKIGAVGIEERLGRDGFIVRTAVNSGSQQKRMETFRRLINAARISHKSRT